MTQQLLISGQSFFRTLTPSVHGGVDAAELATYGLTPEEVIDFSANQSPLGPPPGVQAALAGAVVDAYPDRDARPLCREIGEIHSLAPAQVLAGNGSTELIRLIAQLALQADDRTLALTPTFGEYRVATELTGAQYLEYPLAADDNFALDIAAFDAALARVQPRLCWWCAPNNPTGTAVAAEAIADLVRRHPRTLFVLDEAYCDLLSAPQWSPALLEMGNLIVLRSMTKAWGLAGLRLGYALGDETLLAALQEAKPPWNVNAPAQAAGVAALADSEHYAATRTLLQQEHTALMAGLRARGWQVYPSAAAFFLVEVGDAPAVKRQLLAHRCLVRDCTSFGLPTCIRISPRHPAQNALLLVAFEAIGR